MVEPPGRFRRDDEDEQNHRQTYRYALSARVSSVSSVSSV